MLLINVLVIQLTDDFDDFIINIERNEWDGQQPEVEFEYASDGVYILIPLLTDIC